MITSFLVITLFACVIIFFSPKATKKITHPRKQNYSPINEVIHPTETPLCLWYDVFMPPPLFFVSKIWKKYGGGTKKKKNWILIISSRDFFWHIEKIVDIIIFLNNIQKKKSLGPFNRHKLNINFATENPSQIWLLLQAVFSF